MKKIIFTGLMVMLATSSMTVYAGQGGIAGSSSMIMVDDVVTDIATSIAIGKSSAHSNADTTSSAVNTYAGGGAGELTIADGVLTVIGVEDATNLAIDQSNAMTTGTVSLSAKSTATLAGQASTAAP